jgi:SAM-dependent methyltransferase
MSQRLKLYEDVDGWGAETYDCYAASRGDVPFWQSLAEETGGPVLELGCGTGRLLLPMAEAGLQITGLDLSPQMLAAAERKLMQMDESARKRVRLCHGNMAEFSLDQQFGTIVIPSRNLQILLTRDEQRSCLKRCARHLREGGRLVVQVFNPALWRLAKQGGVDEEVDEFVGPGGMVIRQGGHTDYDLADQSLVFIFRFEYQDSNGQAVVREYPIKLHYFFRFEMEWMLEACGFEVEALYGGFDKSSFAAESGEMIFVARRARGH